MITDAEARDIAMALSGTTEQDHHGHPSFRVSGRIFATMPGPGRLRAMLDEPGIRLAAAAHPTSCREHYWGRRLSCVEVDLHVADEDLVTELLAAAWDRRRR